MSSSSRPRFARSAFAGLLRPAIRAVRVCAVHQPPETNRSYAPSLRAASGYGEVKRIQPKGAILVATAPRRALGIAYSRRDMRDGGELTTASDG